MEENMSFDNNSQPIVSGDDSVRPDQSENGSETDKLKKERDEYLDGWKRAKADLINYRNEELSRLKEVSRFAAEDMMRDILVVLDSFDLGLAAIGHDGESAAGKGMYMIRVQLEDVLKKKGLERVMVSVGREFDPALHEAIASVDSELPSGTIVDEVERGYLLHGKLLRPARVVVSK